MSNPRIYAACLSSYNNGRLYGAWIDVTADADDMREAIQAMLDASPMTDAEEYAIHDYEDTGDLSEWPDLDGLARTFEVAEEVGVSMLTVRLFADDGHDIESFQDAYIGEMSAKEYAYEYIEETGMLKDVPEEIAVYFDHNAFAKDLLLGGDIFAIGSHLFHGNY